MIMILESFVSLYLKDLNMFYILTNNNKCVLTFYYCYKKIKIKYIIYYQIFLILTDVKLQKQINT